MDVDYVDHTHFVCFDRDTETPRMEPQALWLEQSRRSWSTGSRRKESQEHKAHFPSGPEDLAWLLRPALCSQQGAF